MSNTFPLVRVFVSPAEIADVVCVHIESAPTRSGRVQHEYVRDAHYNWSPLANALGIPDRKIIETERELSLGHTVLLGTFPFGVFHH